MSNKFTCSFPEFNFPNLPLLVKGIEVKNCSVKYVVSPQIIALSKFGRIGQWLFLLTNKTAATTKPKLTSGCVKLTSPPPTVPILCLCLLILEDTKTPRAEGKWNYLIYGHFLAFAEPRWKYKIPKENKQTKKMLSLSDHDLGLRGPKAGEVSNKSCQQVWFTGNIVSLETKTNVKLCEMQK